MAEENLLKIPDFACIAAGCKAVWGIGNQLYVSAGSRRPFRDEISGVDVNPEPSIHVVKWNTDMHSPCARKLVNETCSIFVRIQQQIISEVAASKRTKLILKCSREYRSVIKACIFELRQAVKNHGIDVMRNGVDELEMFEMSELLWSLCEILLIDVMPGGLVLRQLLDWWQLRFLEYDAKARIAMSTDPAESDENYWNVVTYFVLQGRLDDALQLLSLHSSCSSPLFVKMERLLKTMPQYNTSSEFEVRWRTWSTECKRLCDEHEFIADPNLHLLSRILAGEEQVFIELRDLLGTWYCMLISKMLYTNPTVHASDLQYYAHDCISVYGSVSSIRPWDSIMLAAMEIDVHQVIQRCSTEFRNWWLVAHLTDLLHHLGVLESHVHNFGTNLREFLVIEYAVSLLSHHSLWQVGIAYLEFCSTFGRQVMADFIEHIPIDSEKKCHKILHICEKYELLEQAKSLCKIMGVQSLHNKRLGSALLWGLRSKDTTFVTHVSEKYLDGYSGSGGFSNIDLIDNLGSSMLLTTRLTFLGKYREFHQLYAKAQLKDAAALLLSLLTARIAPRKFWSMLLLDAIPLLETDKVIFSTQQTYELLHCLEEVDLSKQMNTVYQEEIKGGFISGEEQEKLAVLRLALARNLARSIVQEASL